MVVEYKPNGKVTTHQLSFASIEVRDEVLRALKFRLGAGYIESSRTTSMEDKILAPIFLIVLIAVLAWVLIGGVPLLSQAQGLNTGTAQVFLSNVQQFINQIGTLYIIIAAVLISAACVVWLVLNLRKPSSEVVLRR
jgi:amino acid transporter